MKTSGQLQVWAYRAAPALLLGVLAAIGVVSLWTPLAQPEIAERWFALPRSYILWQVPFLTLLLAYGCRRALARRSEASPFLLSVGLFVLAYLGLLVSLWPYVVPRALTVWDAAAPTSWLRFALVGVVLFMPFVIIYAVIGYRAFHGMVQSDASGH